MDKFVIQSNKKMEEVMQWYLDNKEWLKSFEFIPPFKDGVIHFQEEDINLEFHSTNQYIYQMYIYMNNIKMISYQYFVKTDEIKNIRLIPNVSKEKREQMMGIITFDNTVVKTKMKWVGLMQFSLHFRKQIVSSKEKTNTKDVLIQNKTSNKIPKITIGHCYYINTVPKMKEGKRVYTKPEHAVEFRATYRHYKNGKVVYVKGGTRYSDKGNSNQDRTYKL